ncbi:MAG TPA: 2-oxoacid:acceptor oxidoreductase family protein [Candidatus Omnitrophota bacterium]|nr:2-oxoacid:acceptor oxidoreductase family protein [Candidatus Omnitrophota bacterium]
MATKASAKTKCEDMFFAGFGGQGIMFMGKLLAAAGLAGGYEVTWMPSYGAEVRGGTAYSMTKISETAIPSPVVTNPDILVVMNRPSLLKYQSAVKTGGILISNKSLAGAIERRSDINIVNAPFTAMASKLGDVRAANMVVVGAIAKRSKFVALKNVLKALEESFKDKPELFALNKKAVETGFKL